MAYNAGTAYLQVIPSFRDIEKNIANDLRKMARSFGVELDKQIPKALSDALTKASKDVEKDTTKAAADLATARAQAIAKLLERSENDQVRRTQQTVKKQGDLYAGLGKIRQKLAEDDLKAFDRAQSEETKRTERAAKQRAGILIQVAAARQKALSKLASDTLREQESAERELEKAREEAHKEQIRRDAARIVQLRKEQAEQQKIVEAQRKAAQEEAARVFRGSTAGKAAAGAREAAGSIQDLPIHLNDKNIYGEIQRIRQQIKSLGDLEIGVNIDVEDFANNVEAQFARLKAIAHDFSVDIDVRTDAAAAATQLGGVLVLLNRIDGDDAEVEVNVDTDSARARLVSFGESLQVNFSRLGNLIALGASLGSVIVPAAAAATAAIGALGTAALGAGAGIGVMVLGFGGVGDAVKALGDAADDQSKTNKSLVNSENQVLNAIDGVASARRSLANTIASNRDAAIRAAQSVAKAERDLARARVEADRDAEESARKVAEARRKAARDAVEAAQRVQDAQRSLARDETDAQRAREDLTRAYRDAQHAYEDVTVAIERNSLDQQQALLDIAEAKEELDKLIANPRATEAERKQAQINYERRKLQLVDLGNTQQELAEKYDDYTEKGLEGSREIVDAQERVRDADEKVADAKRDLIEAQKDQQQALIDGNQAIADSIRNQQEQQERSQQAISDAEERLSNERRDRDAQQRQAAFALAGAQQGLVSAQRALAGAYASAGDAGGAALDKVNTAMGKLSPTAQRFAKFIFGLRDDFYDLRAAAADGMLSGLQTAIESVLPYLPAFTDFVRRVGNKLGQLFIRFADSLKDPVFQKFFQYIDDTAVPSLEDLYTITTNLLQGFIGLFLGFTPFSEDITGGVVEMSEAFKDWATTLDQNAGFQNFLQYIRDNGPLVVDFFGQLITFGTKLIEAMAPLGPVVLTILDGFVSFLSSLPEDVLIALVAGIAGLAAGLGILSAATSVAAISTTAFVVAGVIAAVAAAVVGITLLFQKVAPLREFFVNLWQQFIEILKMVWVQVQPILASLAASALNLYYNAFLPAMRGIWEVAQRLWAIFKPIFEVIGIILVAVGKAVLFLWKWVWAPAFQQMSFVITKILVPVIKFLYENVIKPIFRSMEIVTNIWAAAFKVAFGVAQIAMKVLGVTFTTFYRIFIKPFIDAITPFFKWLGGIIEKYVRPQWDSAIKRLGEYWNWLKEQTRKPIKFIVETLLNQGILKGYNKLAEMFDVEPKNVQIPPPSGGWATGGVMDVLPGYSPGVDNHTFISPTGGVIGLSGGEGILRPEVTALVRPWLDEANAAARRGGKAAVNQFLGGYARGGVIPGGAGEGPGDWWDKARGKGSDLWKGLKDKATDVFEGFKDLASDPAGFLKKLADKLINLVPGKDTTFVKAALGLPKTLLGSLTDKVKGLFLGGQDEGVAGTPGSAGGLGGSAGMMRILRMAFPGLPLISGFRPGAITATGNPSYHGKNRATDLPPRSDVFEWIHKNYPNSRELIFSPKGARQIWNGRPHVFRGITKAMHYNHVHWAYDQGGWLPDTREMPGQQMSVFHGRRQPDAVLTNEQWNSISKVAQAAVGGRSGGRGDAYNFDFANSTLTADRLQSIQSRRDTLDRVTRPNW